ncbi:hypothetical protein LASUN_10520 [Lentilactobacillus sunkii]|jgi:hypothetical protein|uniref:Uncharacterized protein n=1 Tax=Lentilactobacillus sunkii TaxID=481719 RepID=A0A1E7XEA3_9LACO|nr:hypothetical protein [Lentilactobacillus sunkii]OFA11443.1 hypothetical protein LASUN_10520 [Lentilactobacillus sunkii]
MKTKTMIATALITAGLGIGAASSPANAANWHNGTPKFLRGNYRHAAGHVYDVVNGHYKLVKNYHVVTITKHTIQEMAGGGDPDSIKNVRYVYLGHHTYEFKGNLAFYGPGIRYRRVHYSGHKIKIKDGWLSNHKVHWDHYYGWHNRY